MRNQKKIIGLVIFGILFSSFTAIIFSNLNSQSNLLSKEIHYSNSIPDIDLGDLPQIDYVNLNASWNKSSLEMIIITPAGDINFYNAVVPLKAWKNQIGIKTEILNNYSTYDGSDDAEKIRNMIKAFYQSDQIRWVLLAGDAQPDLIPIRYVHNPDTRDIEQTEVIDPNNNYKPTDYYYADLTGDWDQDNDGRYGESAQYNNNGIDEIDWIPEVYVGRFPADNANQLSVMVNKTIKYEKNPEVGTWMNNILLAGGISDTINQEPPDGEDESRLTTFIIQNYVEEEMNFSHLVRSTNAYTPPEPNQPLNQANFVSKMNEGYSTVLFAGHGSYDKYTDAGVPSTIYTSSNAQSISNSDKPSLIYADACTTSSYDYNDNNIGEILIKEQNAGAIGYVGALRVTWYYTNDYEFEMLNRGNAKYFWYQFFEEKTYQQGKTLYDSKVLYMESEYYQYWRNPDHEQAERKNLLTYCLLGDPSTDIYTGMPKNVKNPIPSAVYEGQLIEFQVRDINDNIISYPRVYIESESGAYQTIYGDSNGNVQFRLPPGEQVFYNVTITGHNLIQSQFNFTTLADDEIPEILGVEAIPDTLSVSDNLCFIFKTQDNKSGIERVFTYFSNDSFESYFCKEFSNNFLENKETFEISLKKLDPGHYSFEFYLIARDYLNNSNTFSIVIKSNVAVPLSSYILFVGLIIAISITSISVILVYKTRKSYANTIAIEKNL